MFYQIVIKRFGGSALKVMNGKQLLTVEIMVVVVQFVIMKNERKTTKKAGEMPAF